MYLVLLGIQWVGILLLLIEILYIVSQKSSQTKAYLMIMSIAVLINYVGYLMEMQATSKEMAIQAIKMEYLGKPYIVLTFFFAVMEYCRRTIPKGIKKILIMVHTCIFFLVLECGYNTLYYTSIGWSNEGLFPHVVLGHGIIYKLYIGLMGIYFIIIIYSVIRRYKHVKTKAEKKQLHIMVAMMAILISCLVAFLAGVTNCYDTTLPGYLLAIILLTIAIRYYRLLDTVSLGKEDALEYYSGGFVVADQEDGIIYENKKALEIRDKLIADHTNISLQHLRKISESGQYLFAANNVYEVTNRPIQRDQVEYGTLFAIKDVTERYNYTKNLAEEVDKKTEEIVGIQRSVLSSMASVIEARDGITGLHIKNTSNYVKILVNALLETGDYTDELDEQKAKVIIDAAPLHDIGKIAVPDNVLKKPGRLTQEEFEIIKKHSKQGADIINETLVNVESNLYLEIASEMACYHHERWDGTGYPLGLKETQIPLCARIMSLADVYDALRSKRSYKEEFSKEKARAIIMENAGSQFDPKLAQIFLEHIVEIEAVDQSH